MQVLNSLDRDSLLVGQGFNTINALQGGQAVEYNDRTDLVTAAQSSGGLDTNFRLEKVESLRDLRTKLNVSASASCGFGVFSGDASAQYFKSRAFNRYSNFVFADVSVLHPSEVLKRSRMTPSALKVAEQGLSRFLGFCGDAYVYGYQTGGQLTAIAEFTSETAEDFEKVSAQVNAAVQGYGSGGAEFSKQVYELSKSTKYSLTMLRKGTAERIPNLASLAEYAETFPEKIAELRNASVVRMLLRGYETTENFPGKHVDVLLLQRLAMAMQTVSEYLETLYEAQGDLQFIAAHLHWFKGGAELKSAVDNAYQKNEASIKELLGFAIALRSEPMKEVPALPNVERVDPGPVGGGPGQPSVVVELFPHNNFGGGKIDLVSSHGNLDALGFNDQLSSFKVHGEPGEYEVDFYEHINFEGKRFTVQSPAQSAGLEGSRLHVFSTWNDNVSSVRITKRR